jgi:cathepsin L
MNAKGITNDRTYPYIARQRLCRARRNTFVANCTGFVEIESGNEEALKEAVATVGPIAVAVSQINC